MSSNVNKYVSAVSTSSNFLQSNIQRTNVDSNPSNISKPENMLPSPIINLPITSLHNSTESEIANEFVVKNISNIHRSHQQETHPNISLYNSPCHPNTNLNLRYRNMLNYPKYVNKKNKAFEKRIKRSGIISDPTYALRLLQQFLQPYINREIDAIIKKYSKDFLSTAIENIRYNLGESAVSETELQHLQYSIVRDAAAQYRISGADSPCLCSHRACSAAPKTVYPPVPASATPSNLIANSNNVASSGDLRRSVLLRTSARHLHRRTVSNKMNLTSSPASSRANNLATASPPLSDHMGLELLSSEGVVRGDQNGEGEHASSPFLLLDEDGGRSNLPMKRRRRHGGVLNNGISLNGSPITDGTHSVVDGLGPLDLELPDSTSHGQASSVTSDVASNTTGHYVHHHLPAPDHHPPPPKLLISDTFTLGSCANSWLGLGAARGRIYSKHPWIFRYACDREDKGWLSRAGHIPNSGSKAFLVLARQIQDVAAWEEREDGAVIPTTRQPLPQFVLPPWLFQKVLDSTLNRQNITGSRQRRGGSAFSTSTSRHITNETSTSSTCQPPSLQQSTPFVDQFAFTKEEMGLADDLFSSEQSAHSGPWSNQDRSLPLVRNGRNHSTQSNTVYKSGRQAEPGLKIGHI